METKVNIISMDTNEKKFTKSITNINPTISNETLKQAAQLFTAISQNSYFDGTRVNVIGLNEEYAPPEEQKIEPTLSVNNSGVVTYNGDGQLFAKVTGDNAPYLYLKVYNNQISAKNESGVAPSSYSGVIYASAGNQYAAKSTEFSIGG